MPIFNDDDDDSEETENDSADFEEGGKVFHEKYGEGTILKVLKYGERCLIQIDFKEVGKRLLDPKLAKFKAIKE